MGYIVVVCSACRLAKGIDERQKTFTCPKCGRRLRTEFLKKHCRTESTRAAAEAVGQMNARLRGGLDAYLEDVLVESTAKQVSSAIPGAPKKARGDCPGEAQIANYPRDDPVPLSKIDRTILAHIDGHGPSSCEEILAGTLLGAQPHLVEKRLETLRRFGVLYEPSTGKYARVR